MRRSYALLLLACLVALGGCQTGPGESRPMPAGLATLPPPGFVQFCAAHGEACRAPVGGPSVPVALTAERWDQLRSVNEAVNTGLRYAADLATGGVREQWDFPVAAGDCEDFAIEKRRRLIDLGWAADTLVIALAEIPRVGGHAVLLAVTAQGDYVLDIRDPSVRPWEEVRYRWTRRQSRSDPKLWVGLGA